MSNVVSGTKTTERAEAIKSSIRELRIGEITPSAFNPGLSPIGSYRGTEKGLESFALNQQELLRMYDKKQNRNEEKRSYSKAETRKSGDRMYQAY